MTVEEWANYLKSTQYKIINILIFYESQLECFKAHLNFDLKIATDILSKKITLAVILVIDNKLQRTYNNVWKITADLCFVIF